MFRMRRTGAFKVCIRRQTQVFDIEWAVQHGMLRLLRKAQENNEGLARQKSLEVHMPRPRMDASTFDVKCLMPAVRNAHGGKTMAREERRSAGGGMEIRSAHARKTIKINWTAAASSWITFGLCPGTACRFCFTATSFATKVGRRLHPCVHHKKTQKNTY